MRFTKRFFAGVTLLLCLLFCTTLAGCTAPQSIAPTPAPDMPEPTKVQLSLVAAGDNLIHGPIYRQAKARTGGTGFDFTYAYQHIADYIADADLAFINQETPLGGTELGLKSYPMFNSPQELGDHMVALGFNLVSMATNHILDAGERGLLNSVAFWRGQCDVIMAGVAANAEDDTLQVLNCKGVEVALLAYTYGTNGLSLPKNSEAVVHLIDDEAIKSDVAAAREAADIVIVSMHWGVEYQAEPNAEQQRLAQLVADAGADIIIGTHPHVVQTAAMLDAADGRRVPVFYSLGNLISAQNKPATMLGALAEVDMTYDTADGTLTIDYMGVVPVVNHFTGSYDDITVYPLAEYTDELAAQHGVGLTRDYLVRLFDERIPAELQDRSPHQTRK